MNILNNERIRKRSSASSKSSLSWHGLAISIVSCLKTPQHGSFCHVAEWTWSGCWESSGHTSGRCQLHNTLYHYIGKRYYVCIQNTGYMYLTQATCYVQYGIVSISPMLQCRASDLWWAITVYIDYYNEIWEERNMNITFKVNWHIVYIST